MYTEVVTQIEATKPVVGNPVTWIDPASAGDQSATVEHYIDRYGRGPFFLDTVTGPFRVYTATNTGLDWIVTLRENGQVLLLYPERLDQLRGNRENPVARFSSALTRAA